MLAIMRFWGTFNDWMNVYYRMFLIHCGNNTRWMLIRVQVSQKAYLDNYPPTKIPTPPPPNPKHTAHKFSLLK